jgi:hypothetical protein
MLQVNELNQYYGGSHILRGVSFEASPEKSPACWGATAWENHAAEVSDGADPGENRGGHLAGENDHPQQTAPAGSLAWRMSRRGARFSRA